MQPLGLKSSNGRRSSAQFLKKSIDPIKTSNLGSSKISAAMESEKSQVQVIDISVSENASSVNHSNQNIVLEEESGEEIVIAVDKNDPNKLQDEVEIDEDLIKAPATMLGDAIAKKSMLNLKNPEDSNKALNTSAQSHQILRGA